MKKIALATLIAVVAVAGVAFGQTQAVHDGEIDAAFQHRRTSSGGRHEPCSPPGAEAAVLFGDPSKEGLFVLRLKFPEGYRVPPHTHPVDEVLTVISGTFSMGMGENAGSEQGAAFPRGQFLRPSFQARRTTSSSTGERCSDTARQRSLGSSATSTRRTIRGRSRSDVEEHRHFRSSAPGHGGDVSKLQKGVQT